MTPSYLRFKKLGQFLTFVLPYSGVDSWWNRTRCFSIECFSRTESRGANLKTRLHLRFLRHCRKKKMPATTTRALSTTLKFLYNGLN
jgi:hypothetical protein